jgi:membrane protein
MTSISPTSQRRPDIERLRLARVGAALAVAIAVYGLVAGRDASHQNRGTSLGDQIGRGATRPADIPKRGWRQILVRVWNAMGRENLTLIAAGVSFYGLLSIFPALGALVSVYGLFLDANDVETQIEAARGLLPAEAVGLISAQLNGLVSAGSSKLGINLVVGLALALWTARTGASGLIAALNIAYGEIERRSLLTQQALALALTAGGVLFGILSLLLIAIVPAIIEFLPVGDTMQNLLALIRWPLLAFLFMVALSAVYRFAPSRREAQWRWVSWGAVAATVLWLSGSAGFSLYVSAFGSYDKTYGSLGAVVILLLWFWLSALSVLIGAAINAESEHQTARDTTSGPERPMGAREAYMADTLGS